MLTRLGMALFPLCVLGMLVVVGERDVTDKNVGVIGERTSLLIGVIADTTCTDKSVGAEAGGRACLLDAANKHATKGNTKI